MSETTTIVDEALRYAAFGWRIIPLRKRGKTPWLPEWQRRASNDEELIERWWSERPESNLGVQLGERSGIIDFEGDDPRSEAELLELFGGEIPTCVAIGLDEKFARQIVREHNMHGRLVEALRTLGEWGCCECGGAGNFFPDLDALLAEAGKENET